MRPRSHLAIYECVAYITDMSCDDSKRARHRQRQARYEARQRAGVALYPAPLGGRVGLAGREPNRRQGIMPIGPQCDQKQDDRAEQPLQPSAA
jgi:hypothetical protein